MKTGIVLKELKRSQITNQNINEQLLALSYMNYIWKHYNILNYLLMTHQE